MSVSRNVFYGNMCFVCHTTVKEKRLMRCSCCKIVFYCSKTHQRIHWKHHSYLCRIIKQISLALKLENVITNSDWYKYRTKLLMLCELEIGRKLESFEMNMILFPNNCQICHKNNELHPCIKCLCVNYCSAEHKNADLTSHRKICDLFRLCFELDLYLEKTWFYPDYFLRNTNITYLDSINNFIEKNVVIQKTETLSSTHGKALVSELLTCPLSLLFALSIIKFTFKENLIIHVVGGSVLETVSLKSWETILHVIPNIKNLIIHFIGPEVKENDHDSCPSCENKLKFRFFTELYHDYLKQANLRKPDAICCFNCGFHEFESSELDTWKETLPLLVQFDNVPLIFTSFTKSEAQRDAELLLGIKKNLNVKVLRNKFSSLRPYREVENLGVYFSNEYISLVLNESFN